jgi:hypothetical protein
MDEKTQVQVLDRTQPAQKEVLDGSVRYLIRRIEDFTAHWDNADSASFSYVVCDLLALAWFEWAGAVGWGGAECDGQGAAVKV